MTHAAALMEAEVVLPPDPGTPDDLRPLPGGQLYRLAGTGIGTHWQLSLVLADPAQTETAERAMAQALDRVVAQMSQWEPSSQLSRFNAAPAGTVFPISDGFAHVLDCALTIADISDGAFDPALGQASEAWGFGPAPAPDRPPMAQAYARRHDWRAIKFDVVARRLVQPGGLQLDLSGIAKGFTVDLASRLLHQAGIHHHLVEIGGELRGAGVRPDGQPWWVEIEPPPGQMPAPLPVRIALSGWSAATSGDWHRRRGAGNDGGDEGGSGAGGGTWSHSLSPMTGAPIDNGLRAATVLHRGCMQADALATVMMILDPAQGLALADRYAIPARLACGDGTSLSSAAWRAML